MRILLVEDEVDLGEAIKRSLSRDKYVVDWAQDGTQAWDYLENPHVHYSLAILTGCCRVCRGWNSASVCGSQNPAYLC